MGYPSCTATIGYEKSCAPINRRSRSSIGPHDLTSLLLTQGWSGIYARNVLGHLLGEGEPGELVNLTCKTNATVIRVHGVVPGTGMGKVVNDLT